MNYKSIRKIILEEIKDMFPNNRIVCLLQYGPKEKLDGTNPSDFDFLLLLDTYQRKDYFLLSKLNKLSLPVEIFVDYKDQILAKKIENYQRGRHGSYFVKILASADILIGKNFYIDCEKQIDNKRINVDLLYRIEEYFYRIQKCILNETVPNKNNIVKYIGRILTDLFLITGDIQFSDLHKYHYTHIMTKTINNSDLLNTQTKDLLLNFHSSNKINIDHLGEIIGILYDKYLYVRQRLNYEK